MLEHLIINNMAYKEEYMLRAIKLAKESALEDEVPVGCVIVKDDVIIAESGNKKEASNNAIAHAEIVALSHATKVLKNWWLEGCELYVTLEPCTMCFGAMINSRIKALYFGAYDLKTGVCGSKIDLTKEGLYNHKIEVTGGYLQNECGSILSEYFKAKR